MSVWRLPKSLRNLDIGSATSDNISEQSPLPGVRGGQENPVALEVVWSSASAESCEGCKQGAGECQCWKRVPVGVAKIRIEKRRGKTVTVIADLALEKSDVKLLLRDLKKRCATGGTSKGTTIELQGDQVDVVRQWLDACSIAHRGWN